MIPFLILALLGGMIYFFIQSDPEKMAQREAARSPDESNSASEAEFPVAGAEGVRSREPLPSLGSTGTQAPIPSRAESLDFDLPPGINPAPPSTKPTVIREGPDPGLRRYTPWLTPLALDSYMRMKDQGEQVGFWDRGHWITSVEGRWHNGSHEFRIRFDVIPNRPGWQWRYRINLTPDEFLAAHGELRKQGYQLVHSQSFQHPDGRRRYQAVWDAADPAAESSPALTSAGAADTFEIHGPPAPVPAPVPSRGVRRYFGEEQPADPAPLIGAPDRSANGSPAAGSPLDVNNLSFR